MGIGSCTQFPPCTRPGQPQYQSLPYTFTLMRFAMKSPKQHFDRNTQYITCAVVNLLRVTHKIVRPNTFTTNSSDPGCCHDYPLTSSAFRRISCISKRIMIMAAAFGKVAWMSSKAKTKSRKKELRPENGDHCLSQMQSLNPLV
jgi:hypothetical protein